MSWPTLQAFADWWFAAGRPFRVPPHPVTRHAGSHEFIVFRDGQFQLEQVTLFPQHPVPPHCHPDVDSIECHVTGHGTAEVGGRRLALRPNYRVRDEIRRLPIPAGVTHSGVAHAVTVALSFQRWRAGVPPTFITDNWRGAPWPILASAGEQVGGRRESARAET